MSLYGWRMEQYSTRLLEDKADCVERMMSDDPRGHRGWNVKMSSVTVKDCLAFRQEAWGSPPPGLVLSGGPSGVQTSMIPSAVH